MYNLPFQIKKVINVSMIPLGYKLLEVFFNVGVTAHPSRRKGLVNEKVRCVKRTADENACLKNSAFDHQENVK